MTVTATLLVTLTKPFITEWVPHTGSWGTSLALVSPTAPPLPKLDPRTHEPPTPVSSLTTGTIPIVLNIPVTERE